MDSYILLYPNILNSKLNCIQYEKGYSFNIAHIDNKMITNKCSNENTFSNIG